MNRFSSHPPQEIAHEPDSVAAFPQVNAAGSSVSSRIESDRRWSHIDGVYRQFSAGPDSQPREAASIGRVPPDVGRPGTKPDRFAAGHGEVPSERQLTHDGTGSALERGRVPPTTVILNWTAELAQR